MENRRPGRVADYTNANMVLLCVNLLWIFGAVWANWGLGTVLIIGVVLNHLITRLERRRARHTGLL